MTEFLSTLTALRHGFHSDPELGFNEVRTKAKVAKILRDLGLEVHEGAGVVGVLRNGGGNRVIGLRADMDALPISEKNSFDHASGNSGVMHACGHDGHMSMLLGAAMTLSADRNFDGTVIFIFQPNEENGLGAKAMIEEGLFDKFPMDEVYAIHNLPGAPVGQVSTRVGQICSSESIFDIQIIGRGGHASMPHVGVDAITVGAEMVLALQTIVARKMAPRAGVVVSVTEFITDGCRNVLPGVARLKGDVRASVPEDRHAIERFMRQITNGIAAAHDVRVEMSFDAEVIETINAPEPTEAVVRAAKSAGLDIIPDRPPMSFSEDFAEFCAAVPGCFMLLGNGESGSHGQPLHAADYDFNDALLPIGAKLWSTLVQERLPVRSDM